MIGYTLQVIQSFRHKGLKQLFEKGNRRRLQPEYVDKIERILSRLEEASLSRDMNLPGFRLHALKGEFAGYWSVTVSGNWRIIFSFEGGHAVGVDLIDYH